MNYLLARIEPSVSNGQLISWAKTDWLIIRNAKSKRQSLSNILI